MKIKKLLKYVDNNKSIIITNHKTHKFTGYKEDASRFNFDDKEIKRIYVDNVGILVFEF